MVKRVFIRHLVPLAALVLLACSGGTVEKEKVVATVNGAHITAAELQQEAADYGKNNRVTRHTVDDQLKFMIEQKLLIQEAIKMGHQREEGVRRNHQGLLGTDHHPEPDRGQGRGAVRQDLRDGSGNSK